MTNGVKYIKGGATIVLERFEAPRPIYQAPQNAGYMKIKEKDNALAKPLIQESANDKITDLIAKAKERASAAVAKEEVKRMSLTTKKRENKKSEPSNNLVVIGHFNPEDVCKDDREFIIRTRSSDIHSEEMKRLFWANGGDKYIRAGLSYAAAFSNLRKDKNSSLNQKP